MRVTALPSAAGAVVRFRGDLTRHRRPLAGAFAASLGYAATRLAEPWPLKVVFDNVLAGMPLTTPFPWLDRHLAGNRTAILVAATVALLLLAVLRSVFYYHQSYLTARVGQDVVTTLRRRLFAHVQRLPQSFHSRASTGDLLTRLTGDILMLRELLVASLLAVVTETAVVAGFVVVMFLVEWRLALLAVIAVPAIFVSMTLYSARMRAATRKQRRREGELAGRLHEVLAGIHVVQLFGREDEEDERLRTLNRRSARSGLRATRLEAKLNRTVELSVAAATAAVLWFGATQVTAGRLTPGDLIVFFAYMQGFYRPLRRISRVTQRASKASSCVERVTDVLDRPSDLRDGSRAAPPLRGEISFEGVSFAYEPGRAVLRDVDLVVRAGTTLAVVGPTGAGKTTLLGLVPRLYDPTHGAVRVDGIDLRELTVRSLRDQIAVVPQDGMIFSGTIFENIAYGELDATADQVEEAARAACIHEFVAGLPEGYATLVGERGVTLSGGERQRLAIARALVKDAPIVLLDEATTHLDQGSQRLVVEALERLLDGRTALVVAHRLETVRRADEVVVLADGRVIRRGRHDDVLAEPWPAAAAAR
ncbi:MAG TPA: ABC transporter ATP-binding protein [Gaiellaceae bacterium]|nr:ABC transporter ATP-binding protein [Gaiellaceae bacterium]